MARLGSSRWWILVLCIILGGFIGVYLQKFHLTEGYFRDILDIGFDIGDVDLLFVRFGFSLFLRFNLGTFIGGVIGVMMIR
ncbi:MAG: hypothetical protein STSR0007_08820 [Thermovirga sp.]